MRHSHIEQEDAGEGYFASISDLMVGILFIFLLMLAVFAVNYAPEETQDLKRQVAELTRERDELRRLLREKEMEIATVRADLAGLRNERDTLRRRLAELVEQLESVNVALQDDQGRLERVREGLLFAIQKKLEGRVKVEVDTRQGILRLSSEGLFELNESKFTPAGLTNAKALIDEMGDVLPCFSIAKGNNATCSRQPIFETILIEGHTDTQPSAIEGGNWRLSTDRARAFLSLMIDSGFGLSDLRNDGGQLLLGLAGYGDTRPLPDVEGADKRNRRIEIRFLLSGRREGLAERIQRLDAVLSALRTLASSRP